MGLNYIPHQGRSFLGVTKSFVTSGARSNKHQTNKYSRVLVVDGAEDAAAPFNFEQRVHAPVNFQPSYF